MCTKHKHYDLIVAWAEGKQIQWYRTSTREWFDVNIPSWSKDDTYRIKPEPVKTVGYRRYIVLVDSVYKVYTDVPGRIFSPTSYPSFVRWIDKEWQYETAEV